MGCRWLVGALASGAIACSASPSPDRAGERPATSAGALSQGTAHVFVVLEGPAAVEVIPAGLDARSSQARDLVRARMRQQAAQRSAIESEIAALGGVVVADLTRLANALQVLLPETSVARVGRLGGVIRVEPVPLLEPALTSAVPVVGAPALWQSASPFDGDGITIGIVDSGIDYTHADFGGPGTQAAFTANDPTVIEPGSFPTAKVVGGHDFVGSDYFPTGGVDVPTPDPDPIDCLKPQSMQVAGGHGTHVAGIAAGAGVTSDGKPFAGPYNQSLSPAQFKVGPGVAPKAKLYALKIFGCQGGTQMLAPALERAVDPNQDGDLSDRLDVVNASLGTSYALASTTQENIVTNLAKAGTVFVAAAGNEGDAFYATSSPGSYRATLSVAASADSQLIALDVVAPASIAGAIPAAEGGFTTRLVDSGPVSGNVIAAQPANGCNAFTNAAAIQGNVALVDRGQCTFLKKFNNAVAAGALAAIVVDDEDQPVPFAMGGGDPGEVPIPGVMINKSDGDKLESALGQGVSVVMDGTKLFQGPGAELLAGFSSRGPSAGDERLKPEIAAPGFAIDSARVGSGTSARRSQGTSMASPMVAGAAALLCQAKPAWSALEIKAALINSAVPLTDLEGNTYPASSIGAGRTAVDKAAALEVTAAVDDLGTVGMSFGLIEAKEPVNGERSFTVTNHGADTVDYAVAAEPAAMLAGVTASVAPASLSLAPGASATVTLTLAVDPGELPTPAPDPTTPETQYDQPRHFLTETSGRVRLVSSAAPEQSLAVPYFAAVRHGLERLAKPLPQCPTESASSENGQVLIELEGATGNVVPAVTAFQLGATHPRDPTGETNYERALLDLLAVGAATDLPATGGDYEKASVFFGVVIAGEWTTPAQGVRSVVNVYVDSDNDSAADYLIRAEPFSKDGPYIDVLTATTYDLSTQQPTQSKRFLNMLPVTTLDTRPFHNSVLVLSAFLRDLGITAQSPVLSYSAFTQSANLFEQGEQTEWSSIDVAKPLLDTAIDGIESRPAFSGDQVLARLAPEALQGPLPQLLLLHHTNRFGKRYEIVDLVDPSSPPGNVVLAASGPETGNVGDTVTFELTATNQKSSAEAQVKLSGTLSGATIATVHPSCVAAGPGAFDCDLGALAPGTTTSVAIEATLNAGAIGGGAKLDATATVDLPCELSTADNSASASVTVGEPGAPGAGDDLSPAGGCACRAGRNDAPAGGLAGLAALCLALGLRRRPARRWR